MSKNTLTIGQLAEITGLSAHTLRYYERIGLLNDVARSESGRRYYTLGHLGWLDFVMRMRSTGMAISEIIRYAELAREGDVTTEARLHLLEDHQVELEKQIENLQRDLQVIKDKISYYKSLNMPDSYQPQQHHRWHLQINPDEPTETVEKLPSVIWDYLHAKSLQDGLTFVRETDHGWSWASKYHFLGMVQFFRQIFPDFHWQIADIERQHDIYVFCAQPMGTPTMRKQFSHNYQTYRIPPADEFDFSLPAMQIMMRLENGHIVELKDNYHETLEYWVNAFREQALFDPILA